MTEAHARRAKPPGGSHGAGAVHARLVCAANIADVNLPLSRSHPWRPP
jgi:hypothetical protein